MTLAVFGKKEIAMQPLPSQRKLTWLCNLFPRGEMKWLLTLAVLEKNKKVS